MSFLLKIENIAISSKILISGELFFSRSKDRSRTHDQKLSIFPPKLTVRYINLDFYVIKQTQNVKCGF